MDNPKVDRQTYNEVVIPILYSSFGNKSQQPLWYLPTYLVVRRLFLITRRSNLVGCFVAAHLGYT